MIAQLAKIVTAFATLCILGILSVGVSHANSVRHQSTVKFISVGKPDEYCIVDVRFSWPQNISTTQKEHDFFAIVSDGADGVLTGTIIGVDLVDFTYISFIFWQQCDTPAMLQTKKFIDHLGDLITVPGRPEIAPPIFSARSTNGENSKRILYYRDYVRQVRENNATDIAGNRNFGFALQQENYSYDECHVRVDMVGEKAWTQNFALAEVWPRAQALGLSFYKIKQSSKAQNWAIILFDQCDDATIVAERIIRWTARSLGQDLTGVQIEFTRPKAE